MSRVPSSPRTQHRTKRHGVGHSRDRAVMVAALVLDADAQGRIAKALSGGAAVRFCSGREELFELAHRAAAAIIAEPRDQAGFPLAPIVNAIRERFPSVPVIAYIPSRHGSSGDILAMARAGVNELVRGGFDDVGISLRSALASAHANSCAEVVKRVLFPVVAPGVRVILAICLDHATDRLSVDALAAHLALSRRTLLRRLTAAGLPGPLELMGWCRLLVAAHLLWDSAITVEQVAFMLDFSSATSFRNLLWRYTRLRPRDVRASGGVQRILREFRKRLVSEIDATHGSAGWASQGQPADLNT